MPKDRRSRSTSYERQCRSSPLQCSPLHRQKPPYNSRSWKSTETAASEIREWDEARCPICMEHPHNAVLLQCSSSEKGCRAYMCDTSYRHSNCLDQFRKSSSCPASASVTEGEGSGVKPETANLTCPLCRGEVKGWTVVNGARCYMNGKPRSCSLESCSFSGVYKELRRHARTEHPCLRPSEANPERQRDWRRMERQRDIGDLLSGIRSALGIGDWESGLVADSNDLMSENVSTLAPGSPTVYIIYQVLGVDRSEVRLFSRISTSVASRTDGRTRRRPLWGEIIEEESDLDEEWSNTGHDPDEAAAEDITEQVFRIRRRHPRARRNLHLSDEDEPL